MKQLRSLVIPKQNYNVLSPNFHIHVSVKGGKKGKVIKGLLALVFFISSRYFRNRFLTFLT